MMTLGDRLTRALSQTQLYSKEERAAVLIQECNEPLLELGSAAPDVTVRLIVPARREYVGRDSLSARQRVCQMLQRMAEAVAPTYRVVVFDAYRPLDYQRLRFERTKERLRQEHPDLDEAALDDLTDHFVAYPDEDPAKAPPHSTGGAVDMFLERSDGGPLDYGSQPGVYSDEEKDRHATNTMVVTPEQRSNRVRLVTAAIEAGFWSYPGEWWHFMFGDQEYTLYMGLPCAVYGRADLLTASQV